MPLWRDNSRDVGVRPWHVGCCAEVVPAPSSLSDDDRGAHVLEYLLLVGMVALVVVAGLRLFGRSLDGKTTAQADCVSELACDEQLADGEVRLVGPDRGGSRGEVATRARAPASSAAAGEGQLLLGASQPTGPAPLDTLREAFDSFFAWAGQAAYKAIDGFVGATASKVAHAAPLESEPEIDPRKVGVVLHDDPNNLPSGAQLESLGVTSTRISLSDVNFTSDSVADWKRLLADYRAHGIEVVLNTPAEFGGASPRPPPGYKWDVEGATVPPGYKEQFDAWKNGSYLPRLRTAVTELGPYASAFEIWNEPDEPNPRPGYDPSLPPETYGELQRDAYDIVKTGTQERALVVTAGADSGRADYLQRAAAATDGVLYTDAVGLHPYGKDANLPADHPDSLGHIVSDYSQPFTTPKCVDCALQIYVTEASQRDPAKIRSFTHDFAVAADKMPAVERYYFFWQKTSDDHPGLVYYDPDDQNAPGVPSAGYEQLSGLLGNECAPSCPTLERRPR